MSIKGNQMEGKFKSFMFKRTNTEKTSQFPSERVSQTIPLESRVISNFKNPLGIELAIILNMEYT